MADAFQAGVDTANKFNHKKAPTAKTRWGFFVVWKEDLAGECGEWARFCGSFRLGASTVCLRLQHLDPAFLILDANRAFAFCAADEGPAFG